MSAYRTDKITLHPDRLRALLHGQQPAPVQVQVILSDLCNQDCGFCAYRMEGYSSNVLFAIRDEAGRTVSHNPARFLPTAKVLEILDDCQRLGVRAIQVTGGGEPTVHPDHAQLFAAIRQRGFDFGLVTNGVRLGESVLDTLVAPGAETWIRVSLDAATETTYTTLRRCAPGHWRAVQANIARLVACRATGSPLTIGIGFVVTAENYREIVEATRLARDLGVDNLRISGVFQVAGADYFHAFHQEAVRLAQEAETLATSDFAVYNLFGARLADLVQGPPDYRFCGYQHLTTYIGGDAHVYRCCVLAYNPRGMLGSVATQRFADLWEGPDKQAAMTGFDARACTHCQFNDKNHAILAALDGARHGNFV